MKGVQPIWFASCSSSFMNDVHKILRLIAALEEFVNRLEAMNDIIVHQHVDQFHFMQGAAELRILLDQLNELRHRAVLTEEQLHEKYTCVHQRWETSQNWLNEYLEARERNRPIL